MKTNRMVSWIAAALMALGAAASAQDPGPVLQIKAAFVLNFLKFAEWPEEAAAAGRDLGVDVVGSGPLAEALDAALSGKEVQGRTVRVRTYADAAAWAGGSKPGLAVFVATGAAWPGLRPALQGRPVLTISDTPGFCAAGGMLNLFESGGRMKFEANPEATRAAGLKLRAELLKLATLVETGRKVAP